MSDTNFIYVKSGKQIDNELEEELDNEYLSDDGTSSLLWNIPSFLIISFVELTFVGNDIILEVEDAEDDDFGNDDTWNDRGIDRIIQTTMENQQIYNTSQTSINYHRQTTSN